MTLPNDSQSLATIVQERRRPSLINLVLGVALVVAIGGVAFAAGRLTAPAPATAAAGTGRGGTGAPIGGGNGFPQASGAPGAGGLGGAGLGGTTGLVVQGTVQTVGASSITLLTSAGTTIEIPLQPSTAYHGQSVATLTDVKAGQQVRVELAAGAGGFGGRGGPGGGAAASPGAVGSAGTAGGAGRGAALGPALDVTIVTP